MKNKIYRVLCFIFIVYCIKQEALADKEDKNDEVTNDPEFKQNTDANSSSEVLGPPDSHEAMNNRESDTNVSSNREKRSYEFLMGLINNNSKYEVTNVDLPSRTLEHPKTQSAANEALLELMVKIASDPDQWEKVHTLLQKIDSDLKTSKKIMNQLENSTKESSSTPVLVTKTPKHKKQHYTISNEIEDDTDNKEQISNKIDTNNSSSMQLKMTALLGDNNDTKNQLKNLTEAAIKTNRWPRFEETEGHLVYSPPNVDDDDDTKYPWKNKLPTSKTYQRNFAYHRVTGHPFYHTNYDKSPKAYIAVSVIAPKPLKSGSGDQADIILENELQQLKPWTHKQNLKNMAAIRSRWLIQSDSNRNNNSSP